VNITLLLCSLCLVAGGLLLTMHFLSQRRPSLSVRLARARGEMPANATTGLAADGVPEPVRDWAERMKASYKERLRRAGRSETAMQLVGKKLLLAFAVPFVPLTPYAAAVQRPPAPAVVLLLALGGFFLPDLVLRSEAQRRAQAIFLDLPEAVSVMALSLRAGQSLRQALELAARDCQGPLGLELTRALSLARRDRALDEREALVVIARDAGEPGLVRFSELLAAKESPYTEFLRSQAREMRTEQNRYLERAADRAYLAMHAPLIPLLAVLVLILAYGFIHFLTQTV
jgi:Flp pilus assembly protein TadB